MVVAIMVIVCGHHGLWLSWSLFVAIMVCGCHLQTQPVPNSPAEQPGHPSVQWVVGPVNHSIIAGSSHGVADCCFEVFGNCSLIQVHVDCSGLSTIVINNVIIIISVVD